MHSKEEEHDGVSAVNSFPSAAKWTMFQNGKWRKSLHELTSLFFYLGFNCHCCCWMCCQQTGDVFNTNSLKVHTPEYDKWNKSPTPPRD